MYMEARRATRRLLVDIQEFKSAWPTNGCQRSGAAVEVRCLEAARASDCSPTVGGGGSKSAFRKRAGSKPGAAAAACWSLAQRSTGERGQPQGTMGTK